MKQLGILLVDDHLVVRVGLAGIVSFERDMAVVGEAEDGEEAIRKAHALQPDVILMDLMMPNMDGVTTAERILADNPQAKIVVFTSFGDSEEMRRALAAGVKGALVKDSSKEEILSTLRRVAAGELVVCDEIRRSVEELSSVTLSARQLEILQLAAKGFNNREIAEKVGLGMDCVKAHLSATFARLNVSRRADAIAFAVARGLICA